MSDNHSRNSGGIGFAGLLTVVFITLKLCNIIKWSWVWILSPIWIPIIIAIVFIIIFAIIAIWSRE